MQKTIGVYDLLRDVTLIYVFKKEKDGRRWTRKIGTSPPKWVEVMEGAKIPAFTIIPGKVEMKESANSYGWE